MYTLILVKRYLSHLSDSSGDAISTHITCNVCSAPPSVTFTKVVMCNMGEGVGKDTYIVHVGV